MTKLEWLVACLIFTSFLSILYFLSSEAVPPAPESLLAGCIDETNTVKRNTPHCRAVADLITTICNKGE